ncbi:hypothetical protein CF386_09325 [Paraphotobacterium marinum]|uniref:Membrane-anchored protein n=1 Tax=Paraphotobacterium marinum TaxID=1755811 RepID=A0A220VG37_9GAMM|nr:hypothetical protein [Paraphotobacterium marinum]ASK79261.1 hypothetical protein CF386_09325 [Paraphotobacterium marinum]
MDSVPSKNKPLQLSKVAQVTVIFWLLKIISTTIGESSSDFMYSISPVLSIGAIFLLLITSLFIQITHKRFVSWMYWSVIILVAIFGTMFADAIHFIGVPLIVSTGCFVFLLMSIFYIWYRNEKTLDPHCINTTKREIFYWLVILFTFCLGTSSGDFVAHSLHLGYVQATIFFGLAMIFIPSILYVFRIDNITLFWITYILTRPFGASAADLIAKPKSLGGFGLGDGTTSLIFLGVMFVFVFVFVLILNFSSKEHKSVDEILNIEEL